MIDIVELTRQLVRIPSESSDPLNTPALAEKGVLDHLVELCRGHDVSCETMPARDGRDNLMVRFPAPGKPRLLIMAHMDTVSSRGMADPFAATLNDETIHGRGACDDKGPLACGLATLLNLAANGKQLQYDVTFAATVDEEVSMAGSGALAASGETWDLALALEPTSLKVICAHKGAWRCRVTTRGKAAHSSAPEHGDNAIYKMLPIIADLRRYGEELGRESDPELGSATLAITKINGGSSLNIIPDACEIGVDIRLLPTMDPKAIREKITALVGERARVEELYQGCGIKTDPGHPLVANLLAAIEESGTRAETITAPFATDCSRLAPICPGIVWGPGDIRLAHKADEAIGVDELTAAARILEQFLSQ